MSERVPFIVIEPSHRWLEVRWKELWQYRDLLVTLSIRDIKVRFKQTVLGALWAVIQPLAAMLIFTVVFARLAKIPTDDLPAPLFYYAGLLPWTFFAQTVSGASQSLTDGSRLISKVYFPRIMVPLSAAGYTLVNLGIASVILLILFPFYGVAPGLGILLMPVLLVGLLTTALGVGVWIAALNVKYRDFRYVVPFMLQLWMFISPVVYPISMIPERWRWAACLNPMTGLVEGFRDALLGRVPNMRYLAISMAVGFVVFVIGFGYFRRVEDTMADIL